MKYKVLRIILGLLFVVSGWVKAIDPMGLSLKLDEHLVSFGMDGLQDYSLYLSVLLCGFELFLGVMLVFGLWKRVISYLTFLFLFSFTLLTLFWWIFPNFEIINCGCFGDALILDSQETFLKNLVFVILAFFYARYHFQQTKERGTDTYGSHLRLSTYKLRKLMFFRFVVYLYTLCMCMLVPIYSVLYLPPYDYLPYNRGVDIAQELVRAESADEGGEYITKLEYKNRETGEYREFDIDDSEWQDDSKWEYVDTKTITVTKSDETNLNSFAVMDINGSDVAAELLGRSGYSFIIIANQMEDLTEEDFKKATSIYNIFTLGKVGLSVFTASDLSSAKIILNNRGWNSVEAYNVDATILKSMLRNRKGIMMLQDGVIVGKWNFRSNTFANLRFSDVPMLTRWEELTLTRYFALFGLLFALFIFLSVAFHNKFNIR